MNLNSLIKEELKEQKDLENQITELSLNKQISEVTVCKPDRILRKNNTFLLQQTDPKTVTKYQSIEL